MQLKRPRSLAIQELFRLPHLRVNQAAGSDPKLLRKTPLQSTLPWNRLRYCSPCNIHSGMRKYEVAVERA